MAESPAQLIYDDLIIGIDGGGTHTLAIVAESSPNGREISRGTAGPSNMQAIGEQRALQAVDDAISAAFSQARLQRRKVAAAAIGLAGVDHPSAARVVREWAEGIDLAKRIEVDNDATLLLAAGTPNGWGLAVVAGTGSIAFGRTPDGAMARSGGWGHLFGDEGSAYGLAMAGIRAVVRAYDGCQPSTHLTQEILAFMGLREPLELIHAIYGNVWDRARLATIAPLVLRLADEGDIAADAVVETQAAEFAATAAGAAHKLNLLERAVPLAVTGGALLNSESYLRRFLEALRAKHLDPEPIRLVHEPAEGALVLARRLLA